MAYTASLVSGQNTLSVSKLNDYPVCMINDTNYYLPLKITVGSFYSPDILAAHEGDVVEFTFNFG